MAAAATITAYTRTPIDSTAAMTAATVTCIGRPAGSRTESGPGTDVGPGSSSDVVGTVVTLTGGRTLSPCESFWW